MQHRVMHPSADAGATDVWVGTITHRVDYDIENVADAMLDAGLPVTLAEVASQSLTALGRGAEWAALPRATATVPSERRRTRPSPWAQAPA